MPTLGCPDRTRLDPGQGSVIRPRTDVLTAVNAQAATIAQRPSVPTYIALLRFTEAGAKDIGHSVSRALAFDDVARKAGVKIVGQWWTLGRYDGVLVLSCDDGTLIGRLLAELNAGGSVRCETTPAYDSEEFTARIRR